MSCLVTDRYSSQPTLPEAIVFQAEWTDENRHLQESGYLNFSITEIFLRALFDSLFMFKLLLKPYLRPLMGRAVLASQGFSQEMIDTANKTWKIHWELPIDKYINLLKAQDELNGRIQDPSYYERIQKPIVDRRRFYTPTRIFLNTPDGAMVRGMFYRSAKETDTLDIPTIVVFQPNAGILKQGMVNPLLDFGIEHRTPFNVAIIDYRGTGDSIQGNDPNKQRLEFANQLILDGDSLHQCLQKGLGISEKNIRYYGYSLGGAVSAHVRALHHSHAPYVNSHSFTTLNDLLNKSDFVDRGVDFLQKLLRGEQQATENVEAEEENQEGGGCCCCCGSLLAWVLSADWLRRFATDLITFCDLDFNVPKALEEIDENHVLVVHDHDDEFMQFAGTYQCVSEERQLAVTHDREDAGHHMSLFNEMVMDDENRLLAGPQILQFLTQKV